MYVKGDCMQEGQDDLWLVQPLIKHPPILIEKSDGRSAGVTFFNLYMALGVLGRHAWMVLGVTHKKCIRIQWHWSGINGADGATALVTWEEM